MLHAHAEVQGPSLATALTLLIAALVYLRGWRAIRSIDANLGAWHACSFLLGLCLIWIALASPLATLDHEWLTVHMIQHLLLMTMAPPLIWLGAPAAPLLNGLPRFVTPAIRGVARTAAAQTIGRLFSHLAVCWSAAAAALVIWHVPAVFTVAMQSAAWHVTERASFLATGLLFWRPVVQSGSSAAAEPQWSIVLYLFLATLPCDLLAAFLVFSERVAYPIYFTTANHPGMSVLGDQECAAALMWTCVTIVYLVAGTVLTTKWLSRPNHRHTTLVTRPAGDAPSAQDGRTEAA